MSRTRLALLMLLAAACGSDNDPVIPDPDPTLALDATSYWAGSELVIQSDAFKDETKQVSLRLGSDAPLALTRTGATTFKATLPSDRGGSAVPTVTFDGTEYALPAITLFGKTDVHDYQVVPPFNGIIEAPAGGGRVVVVRQEAIDRIDLVSKSVSSTPWDHAGLLDAPGPTPDPDVWVLSQDSDTEMQLWNLDGEPTQVGTIAKPMSTDFQRQVMVPLTSETVLFYRGDDGGLYASNSGLAIRSFSHEGDRKVVMSPDRTRAALITSGGHVYYENPEDGWYRAIPVMSLADGSIAWELTELFSTHAAAFSPDGSKLAVLSVDVGGKVHIYNAANGTHLKDLGMSGPTLRTLGYDPDRGYLYVVRRPEANAMEVVVLAPQSDYQEVARMTAPCARSCYLTTMELFVGRDDALYVVEYDGSASMVATRFQLPS